MRIWSLLLFFFFWSNVLALPVATFITKDQAVFEADGNAKIIIGLSEKSTQTVKIPFLVSGTAAYPADHNLKSGEIIIPPNSTRGVLSFNIVKDSLKEGVETVVIKMMAPANAVLGASTQSTIKIVDDFVLYPEINFEKSKIMASVGDKIDVLVTLSKPSRSMVYVPIITSGSAVFPIDHNLKMKRVVFFPGETEARFQFKIKNKVSNLPKNLILKFGVPSTNISIGDRNQLEVVIGGAFQNKPPVAVINASSSNGNAPLTVLLDAYKSYDDDKITSYLWSFNDGSTSNGIITTRVFDEGEHSVKLQVTDSYGLKNEAELIIRVFSDTIRPTLNININNNDQIITQFPTIRFSFIDDGAGINTSSFKLVLDGVDISNRLLITASEAILQFSQEYPLANGNHRMSASIADNAGNRTELFRSFSVDDGKAYDSYIVGKLLDESGQSVAGAVVDVTNGPVSEKKRGAVTDHEGIFRLQFFVTGDYYLTIRKPGFTQLIRTFNIKERDVDFSLGEMVARVADAKVTTVNGNEGGAASNSDSSVIVDIPPGATDEAIDISVSNFNNTETLPTALPEASAFTYAYAPTPLNRKFKKDIVVNVDNVLGFPIGTDIVVGIIDPELGRWVDSGRNAKVVENSSKATGDGGPGGGGGGGSVSFTTPNFNVSDLNQPTVCSGICEPPGPTSPPPPPPPCPGGGGGSAIGGGGSTPQCTSNSGNSHGGSYIDLQTGILEVNHQLPSVERFGENFAPDFRYNSVYAFPTVFKEVSAKLVEKPDSFSASMGFSSSRLRRTYNYAIVAPGKTGGAAASAPPLFSSSDHFIERDVLVRTLSEAKNADGKFLPSGAYPIDVETSSDYKDSEYASATFFGAPAATRLGVLARVPVSLKVSNRSLVPVVNQRQSPFGAGWYLRGLERIYKGADGVILWDNGDGEPLALVGLEGAVSRTSYDKISFADRLRFTPDIVSLESRNGLIYAADCTNNYIYSIALDGQLQIIAGNGSRGFSGDGGIATEASLNCPMSVFPAERGGFYIADSGNFRIRKVNSDGTIHTIAGNGDATDGLDHIDALNASIGRPVSVAEDKMFSVFFSTTSNKVRFVNPRGKLETYSAAGEGYVSVDFSSPSQITFDRYNNPIVVDRDNGRVIKISPQGLNYKPIVGVGSRNSSKDKKIGRISSISYDAKLDRYYVLNTDGKLFLIAGDLGQGQVSEIVVDNGVRRAGLNNRNNQVKAFTYSKEIGLVTFDSNSFFNMRSQNFRKNRRADETLYAFDSGMSTRHLGFRLYGIAGGGFERRIEGAGKVVFDHSGKMTSLVYTDGRSIDLEYDNGERLVKYILPDKSSFTFDYGATGHLTSVVDPAGRISKFIIDADGNLQKIVNPDGTFKAYTYNEEKLLQSETKEGGDTTSFVYDRGRLVKEVHEGDKVRNMKPYIFNGLEEKSFAIFYPSFTERTEFTYIDSIGGTCPEWSMYKDGMLYKRFDCNGRYTTYIRDKEKGLVRTIISPEGREKKFQYYSSGRIQSVIDDSSGSKYYTYDPVFNKVSSVKTQAGSILYEYNDYGLISKITDPRGNQTEYTYTDAKLVDTITNSNGDTVKYTYGDDGNIKSVQDAKNEVTSFERDSVGNIVSQKTALNQATQTQYDEMGRPTIVTDPLGNITEFFYEKGKLAGIRDPRGNIYRYEYNISQEMIAEFNPLNQGKTFEYDSESRPISKSLKDGREIQYSYDSKGRIKAKNSIDNIVNYSYDDDDLLVSVTDNDSSITNKYDDLKRLVETTASYQELPLQYSYDSAGRREKLRYGYRVNVDYFYQQSVLTEIAATIDGRLYSWARNWDSLNRPIDELLPNGVIVKYVYDQNSMIQSIENTREDGNVISQFSYGLSKTGQIISKDEVANYLPNDESAQKSYVYQYDQADRLIGASFEDLFDLDQLGNPVGSDFLVNEVNQLLQSPNWSYTYDLNGNLVTKEHRVKALKYSYAWSAEGKLVAVQIEKEGTAIKELSYRYDAIGRRIERSVVDLVDSKKSYVKRYVYDGEDILLELDGNNQIQAIFIHAPGADNPVSMLRDENKNGKMDRNELFTFTKDHLGSIREVMDQKQDVIQRYSYSSYGKTKLEKITKERSTVVDVPYGYTSREWEKETGDYFYRARYYDPETGRFLSEDPIGFAGKDLNLYRYALNYPTMFLDPTGLYQVCHRPLEGFPFEIGMVRHDYLVLDDGTVISFRPDDGQSMLGGQGRNNSGDGGGTCSAKVQASPERERLMKKWAEDHQNDRYHVLQYNCRSFIKDTIQLRKPRMRAF